MSTNISSSLTNEAVSSTTKKRPFSGDNTEAKEAESNYERFTRPCDSNPKVPLDIPMSSHYHISWMHAAEICCLCNSIKHGFVMTGDSSGVVKFWKRLPVVSHSSTKDAIMDKGKSSQHPCLEFVKGFTAHPTSVLSIESMETSGDLCVSVSESMLKFYDVSTFDAVSMITSTHFKLSRACEWFKTADGCDCVAVADSRNGSIYIFSPYETSKELMTVKIHAAPVTVMKYNASKNCMVSGDYAGVLDVWNTHGFVETDEETTSVTTTIGDTCEMIRNGVSYTSKMDTDLYQLLRKKAYAIALAIGKEHMAVYSSDHKLRIFEHTSAKIVVTLDERLSAYDKIYNNPPFNLDNIEYGKRAATEREIASESTVFYKSIHNSKDVPPQRLGLIFDPTGEYLLLPCMLGIKILDWRQCKLVGLIGQADAGSLRFIDCVLCWGAAMINQQMQLAMGQAVSSNTISSDMEKKGNEPVLSDTILIAIAYNQRRLYVFSHVDPVIDIKTSAGIITTRDIWNEAPTTNDRLYATTTSIIPGIKQESKISKAILRTTIGDIHIQLFLDKKLPKTIENFIGHCKSGYYDNVLFHRVIKGFMLQTGDPLGDGTGGESIWGLEFEDEIVPGLRHDRPFTVSMANAGPGTNGSQFFITTVPTPWLDGKHTIFGRVVKGMDICTTIENVNTDKFDKPVVDIRIHNVDLE